MRHFWHRWLQERIPTLNRRKKGDNYTEMKEGDIVLIISRESPRGDWPLGKIVSVHPGKDGHIRVAKIQVGKP